MILNSITGLKFCPKCKEDKIPDDFYPSKRTPDRLFGWCRECSRADKIEQRLLDPEKTRAYGRASYARRLETDPEEFTKKSMIYSSRKSAAKRGVPHVITVDDICIPEYCPVKNCGRQLIRGDGRVCDSSPSLDKYKPELGYIPGNIWVICQSCNSRKQDMSGEDHITFGQELIEAFGGVWAESIA